MRHLLVCVLALAGCQKTDPLFCQMHAEMCNGDGGVVGQVKIGGMVTGLSGASGLVLQNNGGDDLPVLGDGAFTFPTLLAIDGPYDVTVATKPTSPSEDCTVTNASGNAATDVNDIRVDCQVATYSIGGTIGGLLPGTQVVLANGGDTVTVPSTATNFTFNTKVASGTGYVVTVQTQPLTGGPCNVFGSSGTVGNSNVMSIVVSCSATLATISGSVSGLNGTTVLSNSSNGDSVTLTAMGSYAFPMFVSVGQNYNVSVTQDPTYQPVSQHCTLSSNKSGNVPAGGVMNLDVTCVTNAFSIGGTIAGLVGTVILQDNGTDNLNRNTNGQFTFATPILSAQTYHVTVATQPSGYNCSVSNGGPAAVMNGPVTTVGVMCSQIDPGIKCGTNYCTAGTMECCDPKGGHNCVNTSASCGHLFLVCDDSNDCPTGNVCCADLDGGKTNVQDTTCATSCGGSHQIVLCGDSTYQGPCPGGTTCSAYSVLPGYYACQ